MRIFLALIPAVCGLHMRRYFGDRTNQGLIEKLKQEEFQVEQKSNELDATPELELKQELLKVADYKDTIREGGLEGSVGSVAYDTPNKLQDAVLELNDDVEEAIKAVDYPLSLPSPTVMSREWISLMVRNVPFVGYISALLGTACPDKSAAALLQAGTPSLSHVFPQCIIQAAEAMSEASKRDYGLRLRAMLADETQVEKVFHPTKGVCPVVASMLRGLPQGFCQHLHDLMSSVPAFIRISHLVQKREVEHYHDELAMLEVDQFIDAVSLLQVDDEDVLSQEGPLSAPDGLASYRDQENAFDTYATGPDQAVDEDLGQLSSSEILSQPQVPSQPPAQVLSQPQVLSHPHVQGPYDLNTSNNGVSAQIAKLRAKLFFTKLWNTFSKETLKAEAEHLLDVWFNDPIHKWRYTIGLAQYFTILGYWASTL